MGAIVKVRGLKSGSLCKEMESGETIKETRGGRGNESDKGIESAKEN